MPALFWKKNIIEFDPHHKLHHYLSWQMQLPKSWFKFSHVEHGFPKDDTDPGQPKRALQQPHGCDHQRPRGQPHPLQSGSGNVF